MIKKCLMTGRLKTSRLFGYSFGSGPCANPLDSGFGIGMGGKEVAHHAGGTCASFEGLQLLKSFRKAEWILAGGLQEHICEIICRTLLLS